MGVGMTAQSTSSINNYVWLLSDWAYLGGVPFVQMATRHGVTINHIPMRMQDVYAGSGGVLLADRSWQRQVYRKQVLQLLQGLQHRDAEVPARRRAQEREYPLR